MQAVEAAQVEVEISIPSGTIKRVMRITENNEPIEFQFLLVRLKERKQHLCNSSGKISIPSGTIKSA